MFAFVLFSIVYFTVIYNLPAAWIWNPTGWLYIMGMRDFAMFVKEVLDRYPKARKLHIILDNLNTHWEKLESP